MKTSRLLGGAVAIALLAIVAVSWCVVVAPAEISFPPGATAGEPAVAVDPPAAPEPIPAQAVKRAIATPLIVATLPVVSPRVRGRVTRSGAPVGGTELSFYAAREAWRERSVDWTITDANGRYEVELPPDCYLVDLQDTGMYAATVVVPPEVGEQVVDIVLPDAIPDAINGRSRASRAAAGRR